MPQLNPEWFASQLFWLLVTFTLLYLLLSRVVLPPLLRVMEERGSRVSGDLARAEELKESAEEARAQYERVLADARLRSQQVFADAALAIRRQSDEANAAMDKTLAAKLAEAQASIASQKQEMYNQLASDSTELVASMVEKFTRSRPEYSKITAALQSAKQQLQ